MAHKITPSFILAESDIANKMYMAWDNNKATEDDINSYINMLNPIPPSIVGIFNFTHQNHITRQLTIYHANAEKHAIGFDSRWYIKAEEKSGADFFALKLRMPDGKNIAVCNSTTATPDHNNIKADIYMTNIKITNLSADFKEYENNGNFIYLKDKSYKPYFIPYTVDKGPAIAIYKT